MPVSNYCGFRGCPFFSITGDGGGGGEVVRLHVSYKCIPSLASLYLFEQCLRLGVMGTSSVCLPLQDESLYVLPNCKSLWIKVSAK